MRLVVYSNSPAFEKFLRAHLDTSFEFESDLSAPRNDPECVYLLHWNGEASKGLQWLKNYAQPKPLAVGICADMPAIREMLECVQLGARAYCNSHMAAANYTQMLRLLSNGQSWFPPRLLAETFSLAQQAIAPKKPAISLEMLTPREQQVAVAVGEGKSNKQIAKKMKIAEPTVKSHLTRIFKKLDIQDRVSLVLYLKPD